MSLSAKVTIYVALLIFAAALVVEKIVLDRVPFVGKKCQYVTAWKGEINDEFQAIAEKNLIFAKRENCNLKIILTSPGGVVPNLIEIVRLMDQAEREGMVITVVGKQEVVSAAALILAHGSPGYRYILPRTYFVLHAPSSAGKCYDVKNYPKKGEKRFVFTMLGPMEIEVSKEQEALAKFNVVYFDKLANRLKVKIRCGSPYAGDERVAVAVGAADKIIERD